MNILEEASKLVHGDRGEDYGHPIEYFTIAANMWSAILGVPVTAEQFGLCMAAMKIARECVKHKTDNLIDCAGYVQTVQMVIEERARHP